MPNLTTTIKSYAYNQYSDDQNIVAFFTAYNQLSQTNLDAMNELSLPNYTNKSGSLLNWIGENLYGENRHDLAIVSQRYVGEIDTYGYNEDTSNTLVLVSSGTSYAVSDYVYKAIIQWNNFKGDGYQLTTRWLKKRIERFLNNNSFIEQTYDVSVTFPSATGVTITIPQTAIYATIFKAAVQSGVLALPFQYTYTVTLV